MRLNFNNFLVVLLNNDRKMLSNITSIYYDEQNIFLDKKVSVSYLKKECVRI